jgi:peptide methionine sulfoxide reductase msrA/msrB
MTTPSTNIATFAGGCFWCIEPAFATQKGVLSVYPGYTGGSIKNPTYERVISGKTGHIEAVQVTFDSSIVSYSELLTIFWRQIDPTDSSGQFADKGSQYITAIFYHDNTQKKQAFASKESLIKDSIFNGTIVTKIIPANIFYRAEDYHQQYYKKNPEKYKRYRFFSGRDSFLKNTWKDFNEDK